MSYSERTYRQRNPKGKEDKGGKTPFFQSQGNKVHRKKKDETLRRHLATSKEDEKLGTNDARMEKDREEPMKPVQKKDAPKKDKKEEKPVQKKGKKDEEKPVQKKDAPKKDKKEEKPMQKKGKKDEEKPVQKKEAPKKDKKEEKPVQKKGKKEEEKPVQKKEKEETSARVAEEIKRQSGKGRPLPPHLQTELGKSMGADLTGVSIHTDAAAAKLCQELHAIAFTHGRDIFFDSGRYNPESPEGRKLLVHELAHVVQQSNTDNQS